MVYAISVVTRFYSTTGCGRRSTIASFDESQCVELGFRLRYSIWSRVHTGCGVIGLVVVDEARTRVHRSADEEFFGPRISVSAHLESRLKPWCEPQTLRLGQYF